MTPQLPQPVGVVNTPSQSQPPVGVVVPPQPLPVVQHDDDDDDDDSSDDDMDQDDQARQPLPRFPRGRHPFHNPGRQV